MRRHLAVAVLAVLGGLVWASAGSALTLCVKADGTLKATAPCKPNETELKVVPEEDFNDLQDRVDMLEELLEGVSRTANPDTLLLTGMNLQVVNGSGFTDLVDNDPDVGQSSANSLGNVVIGYNGQNFGDTRTGSHNLVIGDGHTYTSTSGVVAGLDNALTQWLSFVAGGFHNTVSGTGSFVGGGTHNTASGEFSAVVGGELNIASGRGSFVGGSRSGTASGSYSFVGGGSGGTASGRSSFVAGNGNTASGDRSFVAGGGGVLGGNTATGEGSFVGGGSNNFAGPGTCGFVIATPFGTC